MLTGLPGALPLYHMPESSVYRGNPRVSVNFARGLPRIRSGGHPPGSPQTLSCYQTVHSGPQRGLQSRV